MYDNDEVNAFRDQLYRLAESLRLKGIRVDVLDEGWGSFLYAKRNHRGIELCHLAEYTADLELKFWQEPARSPADSKICTSFEDALAAASAWLMG